jgi:hypothetical protein
LGSRKSGSRSRSSVFSVSSTGSESSAGSNRRQRRRD